MRITKVKLINFKRFDDLTIDLGDDPKKIIALTGPNGCGKSSIFDAFEEKLKDYKRANGNENPSFFSKLWHSIDPNLKKEIYNRSESIKIFRENGREDFNNKSFNIRTAYRFTSKLNISSITTKTPILDNYDRPYSSIAIDNQLTDNYERLLGKLIHEFYHGDKTGKEARDDITGKVNSILSKILDITISDLGDVTRGKGQLYFQKGTSKDFPFENLSSGEKEVVDIIVDLVIKTSDYNDTVFCIDEPELHLNTSIQRKLLVELDQLIPDSCQLWVATHSIGFLRALQNDLNERSQVLDFSEKDYFNGEKTIQPIKRSRSNWQRIFQTALEDLTGLMAPQKIFYCEGKAEPNSNGEEQGLDALIYNEIFEEYHPESLFISAGGGSCHATNSSLALQVLTKAFHSVVLFRLKDRDERSEEERKEFISFSKENKMILRREIENYVFDKETLIAYCGENTVLFDEDKYNSLITNINTQDLKPIQQSLMSLCKLTGSVTEAKKMLGTYIKPASKVYSELEDCIFG